MDTERFIPCLIRTTTGYLKRLHKLYNEHRSAIQSLQYFPERLCWNGKRTYCRNLYGTNVEFRVSEDPDINWFSREVTGLILEVTFQVDDIEIRIIFNSSDDCEKIIEKIFGALNKKTASVSSFLETMQEIRESDFLKNGIDSFFIAECELSNIADS